MAPKPEILPTPFPGRTRARAPAPRSAGERIKKTLAVALYLVLALCFVGAVVVAVLARP
jgi:hypothetical protein